MLREKNIGYAEGGYYKIAEDTIGTPNGARRLENVPEFTGGVFDGIYSGGDGNFIVCVNECEKQNLLDYVKKLESFGYEKYAENSINNNLFFTYQNGVNYIYAYYIENTKSIKVIAAPFYKYSDVTPERIIVKPAVIASSCSDRNFYVRLPDNSVVIIDGGWRIEDRSRYTIEELLNQMYGELREITGEKTVDVPLWVITHGHTDHTIAIEYLHTLKISQNIKIHRILYNFPAASHTDEGNLSTPENIKKMHDNLKRWHDAAGKDFPYEKLFYNCPFAIYDQYRYEDVCRKAFEHYGAVIIKAHSGMRFNMCGVCFEVLHTPEDDMPAIFTNKNDLSLVVKMTYKGSSMLWLGDMGETPGNSCVKMYGDFLKSDAMQVPHHGWTAATEEFYRSVSPSVLFWNNSEFGFKYSDKYQGYGKTKTSTDLYNMSCVKKNIFCNRIRMSYEYLPFEIREVKRDRSECEILASAASDRCFIFKLPDGKLIMFDGGWRKEFLDDFDHGKLAQAMYEEMCLLSGKEKIDVAAWVLSVYDNSFIKTFANTELEDKIGIERIFCGFSLKEKPKGVSADIVTPKTQDEFCICGVNLKILYAPDEKQFDGVPGDSLVVCLEYKGEKFIYTGNMTDRISKILIDMYNDDLRCDVVKVSNHGFENCGLLEFYEKCAARLQLWDNSEYGFRFLSVDKGYKKSKVPTEVFLLDSCKLNVFCDQVKPQIFSFPLKDDELFNAKQELIYERNDK